ncbi:MAG TPA: hypothetical protein VIO11_01550 [Candidatus Methanoperedens sp.]
MPVERDSIDVPFFGTTVPQYILLMFHLRTFACRLLHDRGQEVSEMKTIMKILGLAMLLMVTIGVFPASAEVTVYKINDDGTMTQINSVSGSKVKIDEKGIQKTDTPEPSATVDAFAAITYHYAQAKNYRTGYACSITSTNFNGGAYAESSGASVMCSSW